MIKSAGCPFENPVAFFHAITRLLMVSATYIMGGDTEVSSAIPWGSKNSRPSIQFGFPVLTGDRTGCPISREAAGFKEICGKAAAAPNKIRLRITTHFCIIRVFQGGRDAE